MKPEEDCTKFFVRCLKKRKLNSEKNEKMKKTKLNFEKNEIKFRKLKLNFEKMQKIN